MKLNEIEGDTSYKAHLHGLMKDSVVRVVFTTKSGGETVKLATLRQDILPPPPPVDENADANDTMKKARKQNESQVAFWSVEDNGWRSFMVENLVDFRVLGEDEYQKILQERAVNV